MAELAIPRSASASAFSASCAQLSESTTEAPRHASASPSRPAILASTSAAGTTGSKPRTTARAASEPAAISDPASPSPSTATTGPGAGSGRPSVTVPTRRRLASGHRASRLLGLTGRRRPVRVKRGYGGQAPGLALYSLGLRPADRLPVRSEDQPGARIAQLDPVAPRLVDVQEERLLDRVLVRSRLDEHSLVQADVCGSKDVFPGVGGEGEVVQPARSLRPVVGVDQVIGLLREMEPLRADRPVVEDDLLGDSPAQAVPDEAPVGLALSRQIVHVIKAPDADAPAWVGLGLVLQRGLQVSVRPEPLGLVVELEFVAVGIAEQVGRSDADIAVPPADAKPGRVDRGHPPLQCLLARGAQPGPANP